MKNRRRHQQVQLHLLRTRIELPLWNSLPEECRDEVVALLAMLLVEQQVKPSKTRAGARGESDE
jgi:predicted Fe-S protein YdhL (DUF1289 family)